MRTCEQCENENMLIMKKWKCTCEQWEYLKIWTLWIMINVKIWTMWKYGQWENLNNVKIWTVWTREERSLNVINVNIWWMSMNMWRMWIC